jgi:hypothetical protein
MRTLSRHVVVFWLLLSCVFLATPSANAHNWAPATCANGCGASCTPCTPTFTASNGSPQHPEIAYIFWESLAKKQWTTGTNVAHTYSQEIGFLLSLVNDGPYWSKIAPNQIAPPRLAPYATIFQGNVDTAHNCYGNCPQGDNPDTGFTKGDLDALINYSIAHGQLPFPQPNDNSIYVVFVPTFGSTNKAGCGDCNFTNCDNTAHKDPGVCDSGNGAKYNGTPYTVIFGLGDYDGMSHELVEAMASYEGINTTNTNCGGGGGTQIADMCGCGEETVNTFRIASYYSTTDGECVVPESWGEVWQDPNESGWTQTPNSFPVRQAYGGSSGVVATDVTEAADGSGNAVHFYNGSSWSGFGKGGSQFAAGGGIIAGITLDAKFGVNYFRTSTGRWAPPAGGPNGQPVTGVTVTSNGIIVATDPSANAWYFDPSNPGWHLILSAPWDQVIAGGSGIWALHPAHNALYNWSGPGSSLNFCCDVTQTTQILANPDSGWLAISVAGQAQFTFGNTVISNTLQGGVTNLFGSSLFEFQETSGSPGNDHVFVCPNGVCNDTFGFGGWLISGAVPYVTGCDSGSAPCVTLTPEAPLTQPKFL